MSKSKSLGSSPIGFQSDNSSLSFIPDLGVSPKQKSSAENGESLQNEKEKKVVSYYLEESLILELKRSADERGIYYSTLVSRAIKEWLQKNVHNQSIKVEQHPFLMD